MKDTWKLDATEVCQSDKCCFHQHFSPDLKIKVLWFPLLVKLVLTRVYFKKQKVILLERFSKLASYSKMISQIYISCPKNVLPLLFAKTKLGFNKHFSSLSDTHVPGTHVHHIVWFFFYSFHNLQENSVRHIFHPPNGRQGRALSEEDLIVLAQCTGSSEARHFLAAFFSFPWALKRGNSGHVDQNSPKIHQAARCHFLSAFACFVFLLTAVLMWLLLYRLTKIINFWTYI